MKIYQVLLLTLSTVSIIHCSQHPNKNEDNNAAYHIEFEDKSVHGGYGYKLQVAGKEKYQESWKKDQPSASTVAPTASGTLDYSQNNYAVSADAFLPEEQSFTKPKENNFAQENYLSNSPGITPEKQYSSVSSFTPPSDENKQVIETTSFSNDQNNPRYSTINNFNSYAQAVSKPESSLYASHNYVSPSQDWQVAAKPRFIPSRQSSTQYSSKPSVQIMGTNYIEGSRYSGPQVFVESISGKLNHYPHLNQIDSTPQISFSVNHGSSSNYLQNSNKELHHLIKSPLPTNIPIEYYQPTIQSNYKPPVYKSQYITQLPSVSPSHLNNFEEINSNENINDNPLKYSKQYVSPVSSQSVYQYGTSQQTPYYKDYVVRKPTTSSVQYPSHISPIHSTRFVQEQEVKHSKGNTLHKSVSSSIKQAPHHQTVQYIPTQDSNYGSENNLYKPLVSVNQYTPQISSIPSQNFVSAQGTVNSHNNAVYNPSVLSGNYANEVSSVPLANQEITKYVPHQPTPSVQFKPSIQLPTDYSQLHHYPGQFSQESLASLQGYTKENPQQNVYTAEHQPDNKNVVSYQYKQEFPATLSHASVSPNFLNSPQTQLTYGSKDLTNTYHNLLSGYNTQSMFGNAANSIPLSSFQTNENFENEKGNNQFLYAPGLAYGYDSKLGNGQGLLNMNGFNNIANNGYLGGLFLRRSSGEVNRKHQVDQKQTE